MVAVHKTWGVIPDVVFPMPYEPKELGESSRDNALPWDKIATSQYGETKEVSSKDVKKLLEIFEGDLKNDDDLRKWHENILEVKADKETKISLNYDKRFNEIEKKKKER